MFYAYNINIIIIIILYNYRGDAATYFVMYR